MLGLAWQVVPAIAHAHLAASVPAADATLDASPSSLKLTFSERVEPKFTGAAVIGPDQAAVSIGPAVADPKSGAAVTLAISDVMKPGKYNVTWHALSADGHKTTGKFSFSVK